jgi:hypothetical protein
VPGEVGDPAAEHEQAAERQAVRRRHQREPGAAGAELAADGGQRDQDHRDAGDEHQLHAGQQPERHPRRGRRRG